jgi:uncharacterized peroxidase-related enzyme
MAHGEDAVVKAALADYRTAPISEKLRAALGFVEKLTLRPAEVGPADVAPLRAAGLTGEEIEDAIHVCALFNVINRAADSLGFQPADEKGYRNGARFLLSAGYR